MNKLLNVTWEHCVCGGVGGGDASCVLRQKDSVLWRGPSSVLMCTFLSDLNQYFVWASGVTSETHMAELKNREYVGKLWEDWLVVGRNSLAHILKDSH